MAKCAACHSKKGKRNCPALGAMICSFCCGAKREKEIDCPDDCFYLGKARKYFEERDEEQRVSDFDREMRSMIGHEDAYLDVLQNIEFMLHQTYQQSGDITDRDVETALEYLFEMGKGQLGLPAKFLNALPPHQQMLVDAVDDILKLRESVSGRQESLMDKLRCIYRILDSVKTHYNPHNPHSYLLFIGQFLP